jgi:D-serine deaminase-like pyridoxal phosphate-dependent protein
VLWDAGYGTSYKDLDFLPAAVLAGRVISRPESQLCLDLGHKAVASEMAHPRLFFLGMDQPEMRIHSEEHLVIFTRESENPEAGDLLYALPTHICPTMALHEKVYVVENQRVVGTWEVVARKRNY